MPSRKWWAATVVALGTIATAAAQAGEWSSTLTVLTVGVVVGRATAWLVPNKEDGS